MRKSIIATVGTSIIGGLNKIDHELCNKSQKEIVRILKENENLRFAGAEIHSIESIIKQNIIEKCEELFLLISDTAQGELAGNVIAEYFKNIFGKIRIITIKGLDGSRLDVFKDEGLRNLTKVSAEIIRTKQKSGEKCIINATGGYKAQISFAGLIGQAFKVPVYYLFEGFSDVIELPSMPVTVDYRVWLKYFNLFDKLYKYGSLTKHIISEDIYNSELKDLTEYSGGQYRLSSMGILMHEALLSRFQEDGTIFLPERTEKSILQNSLCQGNIPETFENLPFVFKALLTSINELPYVTGIKTVNKPNELVCKTGFEVSDEETGNIKGFFCDGTFTWEFIITTTAENKIEANAAAVDLNIRFGNPYQEPAPGSVEFILIRHAEHTGQIEKRVEGLVEFDLTDNGRKQAELLASKLTKEVKMDMLYSSSLKRALDTAEYISEKSGLKIIPLDDMRAVSYGKPGGVKTDEAEISYPDPRGGYITSSKAWDRESELDFGSRILQSFYEIYYAHPGKTVAIVTHGRAISIIMREIMRMPISEDFRIESADTSVHRFVLTPDKTILKCVNNVEHLK